jgi:capsular polysaccharide biosynthesis protein
MELWLLWKIIKRRWWLIALPALAALVYAVYGYLKAPPGGGFATQIRYTAAQPPDEDEGLVSYEDDFYHPWTTSEYIMNGLMEWVRTNSFAQAVSEELAAQGMEIPAGAIQGAIVSDSERSVMTVYFSWPDADQLEAIAEAATVVLQTQSEDYFPQLAGSPLEVAALDDPMIGAVPPPLTARLNPVIRFGLGLGAGFALALLVDYLDRTVRTRSELEAMGLPVLAAIPKSTNRNPKSKIRKGAG